MEIYTGDFISDAQECADKISNRIGYAGYFVEDECCNLTHCICKKIYNRLSVAFEDIIERSRKEEIDLKKELFKTINEL